MGICKVFLSQNSLLIMPCCTNTKWYKGYLIWNALRFATVGTLVYLANDQVHHELVSIIPHCCNCYLASKDPPKWDPKLRSNQRFDLSYCIPNCIDCKQCDTLNQTK